MGVGRSIVSAEGRRTEKKIKNRCAIDKEIRNVRVLYKISS